MLLILTRLFQDLPEARFANQTSVVRSMAFKKRLFAELTRSLDVSKKSYIESMLGDLSFDPKLPALSLFQKSRQQSTQLDRLLPYFEMDMDSSEFLIMAMTCLKSMSCKPHVLQKLYVHYLFVEYDQALSLITSELKNNNHPKALVIVDAINQIKPFDPKQNDSRRFYETRLSQYINGLTLGSSSVMKSLKEETQASVNRILTFYFGTSGHVQNPQEMEYQIARFAQGYKDEQQFSRKEIEFIKSLRKSDRIIFKGSDRKPRVSSLHLVERKFETSKELLGESLWNSSGGVLKNTSPTFFDSVCGPVRNMLVDVTEVSAKNNQKQQWYWNNNRQYTSYVGSISGHTCEVVGTLVRYMKQHHHDQRLERDIHLFLVQLTATYTKRGYHSFLEVIDVLHDPPMQELFNTYGIHVDLYDYFGTQEGYLYLDKALEDASDYTRVLLCKRDVAARLK